MVRRFALPSPKGKSSRLGPLEGGGYEKEDSVPKGFKMFFGLLKARYYLLILVFLIMLIIMIIVVELKDFKGF